VQIEPNADKAANSNSIIIIETVEICMKVMTHFERRGCNFNILEIFIKEIGDDFYEEFLQVLLARQRFQNIL